MDSVSPHEAFLAAENQTDGSGQTAPAVADFEDGGWGLGLSRGMWPQLEAGKGLQFTAGKKMRSSALPLQGNESLLGTRGHDT